MPTIWTNAVRIESDKELTSQDLFIAGTLHHSECQAVVDRLLSSTAFAKSPRLLSFLKYICDNSLAGDTSGLTEQQIGVQVFGRPTNYNPGDDNIVRVTARQLRQRLALYYQDEARNETIHIEVPRGGYSVSFRITNTPLAVPDLLNPPPESSDLSQTSDLRPTSLNNLACRRLIWQKWTLVILALSTLMCVAGWIYVRHTPRPLPVNPIWSQMFTKDHQVMLVPGDAGLNIFDNLERTQVSLEDYISGAYLRQSVADTPKGVSWAPLADRRYTSDEDLRFADRLRQQNGFRSSDYEVRFARDLKTEDFRGAKNLILLGAPPYNPWVQLFDARLNFRMHYNGDTNTITVFNAHPQKGELSTYQWAPDDPQHQGYATIALVPNLDDRGTVLIIQGTSISGMDGAMMFLMGDPQFASHLPRNKTGGVQPFEMLLETTSLLSSSTQTHLLAVRAE